MSIVLRLRSPALRDPIWETSGSLACSFNPPQLCWQRGPYLLDLDNVSFPRAGAGVNFICSLVNLWNAKWTEYLSLCPRPPVFEALQSGPWQLAHSKFPRHNLNVISGLGLGHEYLRCKLFGSCLNLLWILLDEKNESLLFDKVRFPSISLTNTAKWTRLHLPERIRMLIWGTILDSAPVPVCCIYDSKTIEQVGDVS